MSERPDQMSRSSGDSGGSGRSPGRRRLVSLHDRAV